MATPTDIRVLVPRVQRAVEGVVQSEWTLNEDQVKDLVADAMSDVLLYTGSVFGKTLDVTDTDDATGAPSEYATSDELSLQEGSVIAAQAALTYFFYRFAGMKVTERIADEAQSWEYGFSPNLIRDQLKVLVDARDKALEALEGRERLASYVSFLEIRDSQTARLVEPFTAGAIGGPGLQADYRFNTVG